DNINHSAHLFGAIAGAVLTILLEPAVVKHFLNHF
ncbi:MAG TPA: rhomboid family intramembrane serine protease, partial [Candidatus Kapabacteria bacterium]|nr:rhomboid family intramembrane serine protease [Candidatus Kapabacteria bacterium]